MDWFWPVRTGKTVLDVWTIMHVAFWVYMASNFYSFGVTRNRALFLGVVLSFAWEFFERFAEHQWPDIWQHPESFANAYVSDPLTSVLGVLFSYYVLEHWRV